jgi:hypothetical protein
MLEFGHFEKSENLINFLFGRYGTRYQYPERYVLKIGPGFSLFALNATRNKGLLHCFLGIGTCTLLLVC